MASSGFETMLSASTFSKQDITYLIKCIMQAMTLQQTTHQSNNTLLPGGNKSGHMT